MTKTFGGSRDESQDAPTRLRAAFVELPEWWLAMVRAAVAASGLSQRELAESLSAQGDSTFSQPTVHRFLTGERTTTDLAAAVVRRFDLPPPTLMPADAGEAAILAATVRAARMVGPGARAALQMMPAAALAEALASAMRAAIERMATSVSPAALPGEERQSGREAPSAAAYRDKSGKNKTTGKGSPRDLQLDADLKELEKRQRHRQRQGVQASADAVPDRHRRNASLGRQRPPSEGD